MFVLTFMPCIQLNVVKAYIGLITGKPKIVIDVIRWVEFVNHNVECLKT